MATRVLVHLTAVQDAQAGPEVQKIGVAFRSFPPEPVVVSNVAADNWGQRIGFQGGEEVVAVNGVDVTNMTREEFKDALKERPLTLRFRVQPEAPRALRAVVAAAEVDKLGLSFSQLPPSPVVVNKVMGWAQIAGFEGGEEIVMLNGKQVSAMSSEEFKAALKERPLDVRFELPEDEAVIEEVTATEEVTKIGLAFDRLPPEPVVVKKVAPGTWADEMGFQRGDEILEVNGQEIYTMDTEAFTRALRARPLVLRYALSDPEEVIADASVEKIGLSFRQMPPERVIVNKVAAGTWAEVVGLNPGDEIVALNGQATEDMDSESFKAALKTRPLVLRYFPGEGEDQSPSAPSAPTSPSEKAQKQAKQEAAEREQAAATKIQAIQRGKNARKATEEQKKQQQDKKSAAQLEAKQQEEAAATKIQAIQRGKNARKATEEQKKQQQDKKSAAQLEAKQQEEAAATKIQAIQRGKNARKATEEQKKQQQDKKSAVQLEAKQQEEAAATKIQAIQRGKNARKATEEQKKQQQDNRMKSGKVSTANQKASSEAENQQKVGSQSIPAKASTTVSQASSSSSETRKRFSIVSPRKSQRSAKKEARPEVKSAEATASKTQEAKRGKATSEAEQFPQQEDAKRGAEAETAKSDELEANSKEEPSQALQKEVEGESEAMPSQEDTAKEEAKSKEKAATKIQACERRKARLARAKTSEVKRSKGSAKAKGEKPQERRSGSPRQRASVRSSLGEADVKLRFQVRGLQYEALEEDVAAMVLFEGALKMAIVQQAGARLLPQHVQLSASKSLRVSAKISAPVGVPLSMLFSCLDGSRGALCEALEQSLANTSGLGACHSEEPLAVDNLELEFGEASRKNSFVASPGRFVFGAEGFESFTPPSALAAPATPAAYLAEEWGGATGSGASPPRTPRTPGTPRRPASAPTRGRKDASALSRFRAEILRREGTFAAAWRLMDSSGNGFVTHAEFCDACRRINYRGNVRDAWHELDADGMGKATLCELDWATAEALGRFCTTLAQTFGAVDKAARLIGLKGNRRLRREDFRSLMTEHNLLSSREADGIFRMMCSHDTMARPSVREKEFQWLVQLSPSLPRPGRVAPGGQELELPGELPSDANFAEPEVRTPRNRSQPLRRQEAGDDEALYDRLWQEAQEFHKKKQEKHAKEGLYRHPRDMTPTSNPRCGNQAHCEKLYKDSKSKMQKQERVEAEERKYYYDLCRKRHKRTTRDEEVWARLVQTKPREEKEEEKGDSQTELPEGTKTKAEKAAERLWAKAVKTQREKKEQAAKEKPDISIFEKECARRERQRSKEEPKDELQQKKLVAARAKDYVQRLQEDLQRKQQENRLKKQELERQAEESKKPRQPRAVKARPETFYRLHLDGMQREEALAERRRIKEMEEEYQLKARSIHSRSAHNPQVFSRLYSKTPREAQLDAEESAYSGSELYEDATRLDASSFLARAKPGSASEPREDESNGEEPADETTPASQEHRRSSEEDLQQTLQELREARRSRLAMKDWMETQRQELQATASSRSRVAPGDRTEVPPESGKPDLASASAELQALLQRRPGSGSKRRSMAATKLSQELFGDESPSSPGSPGSPAREPPLPSHSSHSELWGAMAGMVSWNEEQP